MIKWSRPFISATLVPRRGPGGYPLPSPSRWGGDHDDELGRIGAAPAIEDTGPEHGLLRGTL